MFFDFRDDLYGQKFAGYFKAPINGTFKFYISGDSSTEIWLSKSQNSSNLQKIAYTNYSTGWRSYYESSSQISQQMTLNSGQFYSLEAYHAASWGNDHLTVSVEVPSKNYQKNSIVQQQTFFVTATIVNEQIRMKIYNMKGGNFTFVMQTVNSLGFFPNDLFIIIFLFI